MRTAPWEDGDILVYDVYEKYQKSTSTMTYTFSLLEDGWWVESTCEADSGQAIQGTLFDFSLAPSYSIYDYRPDEATWFVVEATYTGGHMTVTSTAENADPQKQVFWPKNYGFDDNNQLFMTLRLFEYTIGVPFNICIGFPLDYRTDITTIGVSDTSELIRDGQPVRCLGVKIGRAGALKKPQMTVWLTDDEKRIPLRIDGQQMTYVLQGVEYTYTVK